MIVARGLGRSAYLGAIVATGLCITAPTPVEAESTQVYGGSDRRGRHIQIERMPNDDDALAMMLLLNAL
jgi:hypothetical protein